MSSETQSTDSEIIHSDENSNLNNFDEPILIEDNSPDTTATENQEQALSTNSNNALPLKAQVLPMVYIQNNNTVNPANKFRNNFIIQPMATNNMTFVNRPIAPNTANPNATNVIFAGRGRPLVLPKKPITIMPQGTKMGPATYVTMLKPLPKSEGSLQSEPAQREGMVVPQKSIVLTGPITKLPSSKLVEISPMPKLQPNRPPITATTNCNQSSKFSILPMPVPQQSENLHFQIADGKLYSNMSNAITIMKDERIVGKSNIEKMLLSTEKMDDNSPEKNDINNQSYELSIAEESLSNQSDCKLIVSSGDSCSSAESLTINKHKFTHGVSILKKNHQEKSEAMTDITISTCFVSATKDENDIKITKSLNGFVDKDLIVTTSIANIEYPRKPEKNRRKSQFNFRKDFDDIDIIFESPEKIEIKEDIKEEKPDLEIKIEKVKSADTAVTLERMEPFDPKTILEPKLNLYDAAKFLKWEENIGCLPDSNLKFLMNEFGIIEYLEDAEYDKIMERRKRRAKEDLDREVQCVECGCYGIKADFYNTNFCSYDCQAKKNLECEQAFTSKGTKRKFSRNKSDNDIRQSHEYSDEDENSNETSSDRMMYPWACKKKGFSWSKYLTHVNALAAPVKLFKDPFPYTRNGFKIGMKLEGVDPQHPSYFCVLTVVDVMGYRIRLHFDGFPSNYDFWTYADSMDIFPMGWCEKYGHVLQTPPGYDEESFNWVQYLKVTKTTGAPKHLFLNRAGQAICPNGFRIGMKLEAVDKKDSSLICVATIRDMMDNRILVHFDGWDDIYDYWADPTSPYIHPVGWCDQYGHNLTPPSDHPCPENFTWESYLKETKSVAAPIRAFKQRAVCGFKRGMRLECVDKRVPQLIRVATVDDVKDHQIRIHFDGWPDRYSYWVDDDSPDIHPVGWCQKTGHPMEPPLTPDDVFQFLECPTVGCRGQGHISGLKYPTHSSQKFCPYSEAHIDMEKTLPDRLLSPDKKPESKEPVSRQPKDKKVRIGRPPKWLKAIEESSKKQNISEPPAKKLKKKQPIQKPNRTDDKPSTPNPEDRALNFIESSKVMPAERETWHKHSRFLIDYVKPGENPFGWSGKDVTDFVSTIPGCDLKADIFEEQCIDGESFLELNQSDIRDILNFEMGPAIKLYNCIVLLREQYRRPKK